MENVSLLELRGHHLGIVYNILAEFKKKAWTRKDIEKKLSSYIQTVLYPRNVLQTAYGVPHGYYWRLFFGKSKILIVEGPDPICESGCIQVRQRPSPNIASSVAKEIDKETNKICLNKFAKEDLLMLKIFSYSVGQVIPGDEIVKQAYDLVRKFNKFDTWQELICFHEKTSR